MQQQTEQQIFGVPQPTQGPSIVYVQAAPSAASRIIERYLGRQSIGLGIAQIVVGALCIVFNVVAIILFSVAFTNDIPFIGHGIWCGIMFIITGGLGIAAGKTKKRCQIVSFNVMCILSASITIVLLALGITGACTSAINACNYGHGYGPGSCGYYSYGCSPYYQSCYGSGATQGAVAMESMMAILAVIEAVVAIWGSAICCKAVCCCDCCCDCCASSDQTGNNYYQQPTNGQVIYVTQTQGGQTSYLAAQPMMQHGSYLAAQPMMQPGLAPGAPLACSYPPNYAQIQHDVKI